MPIQLLVLCSSLGLHVTYPIDMVPGMLYYGAIINLIYLHGYHRDLGYLMQ